MNLFNRVLLVIILTAVALLAVSVIVFAWAAPASSANALDEAVDWLQDNQGVLEKTLVSTGAALVALVAITVLYLELVPRTGADVTITDLRIGNATLSTDAISQRVEEAVSQLRYVSEARARVEARQNGVVVDLDLHVEPEANLAAVTDAACEATRDVLANRVHVALLEPPTARLHYREARRERPQVRRPILSAPSSGNPLTPALATAGAASGAARAEFGNGSEHFESGNGRPAVIDVPRPPEAVRESPTLITPAPTPQADSTVPADPSSELGVDQDTTQAPAAEAGADGDTQPELATGSDTRAEQGPAAYEPPPEPPDMEPRRRI